MDSDWFIFTLGLTEAWRSKLNGAIYPLAPGVAGGEFNPLKHEFVNFKVGEIIDDLSLLISSITSINPTVRVILTVSPVPLVATYEDRHVLVSTVASKAALRVAADEVERNFKNVTYFPSYEIISSPANGGRYFKDDLREVTEIGVNHVMRIFTKHFLDGTAGNGAIETRNNYILSESASLVCDEEEIKNSLHAAGFR